MASNVSNETKQNLDHMKKTLLKSRKLLCEYLRLHDMLRTLITMGAVTPDDATRIRHKITDSEQVEALLDILSKSPVSAYEAFMSALKEDRPDLYKEVKAIEDENSDTSYFDLKSCQQELITVYKKKMRLVTLIPWFEEETRYMEDIYCSLELENGHKILKTNEELFTISTPGGTLTKMILVKGTVGLGKSTFMAKLAYTWAQRNPRSLLYQYDLAFFLSFREINSGCSIIDAIFQQILADDTRVSKVALDKFIHSTSNILFLMDGFDEYYAECLDNIQGEIDAMLNFKTFREACIIMTSRPHKRLGKCQSLYTPVTLKGFSSENVQLYLSKFFYNNAELVKGLSTKLSESDNLRSLSHIPIMLMLMCLLWEDSQSLPNTQSELYAEFTKFFWRKFCQGYDTNIPADDDSLKQFLISLGKVALDGLLPKEDRDLEKLVFFEADFLDGLEQGCQVGLLTKERLKSKLTVSTAVTFLHKSFQEYCASYYWASLPGDKFGRVLHRIDTIDKVKNKSEILEFLCGICDTDHAVRSIHHVIQVYLAQITNDDVLTIDYAVYDYDQSIRPVLMMLLESNFPSDFEHLTDSLTSLLSAGKALRITNKSSHWHPFAKSPLASTLNQVHSVHFEDPLPINTSHISGLDVISESLLHMPNVENVDADLYGSDYPADSMNQLGSHIGRLKNLSKLILCSLVRNDVTQIMYSLIQHCEFQLKSFSLLSFDCDGGILSHLLANQSQLHTLKLDYSVLSNGSLESVLDAIKAPLNELSIEDMHVVIGHIKHIIPHLHCLKLHETGLEENDIVTLGEMLPNAKHLTSLDLSNNRVGKAVCALGCVIPQLKNLNLHNTHLDDDDMLTLSEFLTEAKCLSRLNLTDNNLGKATGRRLCDSLKSCSNLEELDMEDTGLTQEDVSALKQHLPDLKIWAACEEEAL